MTTLPTSDPELEPFRQGRRARRKAAREERRAAAEQDGAEAVAEAEATWGELDDAPPPLIETPVETPPDPEPAPAPALLAVAKKPAGAPPPRPRPPESKTLSAVTSEDEKGLKEYIQSFASGRGAIRVAIVRDYPREFQGENVKGTLDTVDFAIDEDEIKQRWGGGRYTLKIMSQNDHGSFVYRKSRVVEVAGDPKPMRRQPDAAPASNDPALGQVVGLLERTLDRTRQPAPAPPPAIDMAGIAALIQSMSAPMQTQLAAMMAQAAAKDERLLEVVSRPAPVTDPLSHPVLEKIIDAKGSEIQSLRAAYESEIRQLKQSHQDDIKRVEDRHMREVDRIHAQHEREITALKSSFDMQTLVMKGSEDTRKELSGAAMKAYERENEKLRDELKELRAKKEKTLVEQLKEVEVIKDLIGGKDDGEEKSTALQIMDGVLNSPLAKGLGERIGGMVAASAPTPPPAAPAPAPNPQLPPPGTAFQMPNGQWVTQLQDGRLMEVVQQPDGTFAPAPPAAKRRPKTAAEQAMPGVDPEMVKLAVAQLEQAFRNGTPPDVLAQSARAMVPEGVLHAIRKHGVDDFLDKMAQLDSGSPLSQTDGRIYARAVAKHLTSGKA